MNKSGLSEDVALVSFELPSAVSASSVSLCGDFNDWSPDAQPLARLEDGRFRTVIELPTGRRWRFRYLLDGERWENDWAADDYIPNDFGTHDSVVDLTSGVDVEGAPAAETSVDITDAALQNGTVREAVESAPEVVILETPAPEPVAAVAEAPTPEPVTAVTETPVPEPITEVADTSAPEPVAAVAEAPAPPKAAPKTRARKAAPKSNGKAPTAAAAENATTAAKPRKRATSEAGAATTTPKPRTRKTKTAGPVTAAEPASTPTTRSRRTTKPVE